MDYESESRINHAYKCYTKDVSLGTPGVGEKGGRGEKH